MKFLDWINIRENFTPVQLDTPAAVQDFWQKYRTGGANNYIQFRDKTNNVQIGKLYHNYDDMEFYVQTRDGQTHTVEPRDVIAAQVPTNWEKRISPEAQALRQQRQNRY